ncbi:nocturnin isoform X2 [Denticeps clupeoides]|uniref:Nocturnin n=2 Tax=Denticeps clupeoides TaxID=299321 RepID=A0AAY4AE81_9TELE|nr:nocturnin-like isoform X2 [Denticeps clupeoides]XP_028833256.1 nocturnin-like isoform X2 [Denticeps clupeoides]
MGNGNNRPYSKALPHLSPHEPCQGPDPDPHLVGPLELRRECADVLRGRPALLRRDFVSVSEEKSPHQPFRVMQWNSLAQALGEGMDSFTRCPPEALNWPERKYMILEEILTYQPDILCLQEVDHYFDTFQPLLVPLGYQGSFCPKPWSLCLNVANNNGPDGCVLFFRCDRFQLRGISHLQLSAMGLKTNQVAIVATLCCRATGQVFCIAVTHLKARSGWKDLRTAQGDDLLCKLQSISRKAAISTTGSDTCVPILVCGDFNAEPSEVIYHLFATSTLGLDSAYKHLSPDGQTEPAYTTWKIRSSGESCHTLDYVWYSRDHFSVRAVLDFPTAEQIGPNRLPSYSYPSDHLSLVCDFSFSHLPE